MCLSGLTRTRAKWVRQKWHQKVAPLCTEKAPCAGCEHSRRMDGHFQLLASESSAVKSEALQNSEGARVSKKPRARVCKKPFSPLAAGQRSSRCSPWMDTCTHTGWLAQTHSRSHTLPLTAQGGCSQRPALLHTGPC